MRSILVAVAVVGTLAVAGCGAPGSNAGSDDGPEGGSSNLPPCDGVTCRACIHQPDCNVVGDHPYACSCDGGSLVCIDPVCERNCAYGEGPYTGTPCDMPGLACSPSDVATGCLETCTCDGRTFVCPGCPEGGAGG